MDVGVVGGSGYAGAELLRLLAQHPTFKLRTVAAGSSAGRDLAEVFPHLGMSGVLEPTEPGRMAGCEVVFLATPHAVSMVLAPPLIEQGATVVDLSGAFRLEPEAFTAWYDLPHTAPDLAPAPYGLPELCRDGLGGASLIAGPGCYPTASLLALAPLAGLIDASSVSIVGMSGTSGAGKGLREDLHASHAFANVSAYSTPGHRHTPEIERVFAAVGGQDGVVPLTFVPHLVPMARGLVCTVTATLAAGQSEAEVRAAYLDAYGHEPFVTLLDAGTWPATARVSGGNAAHVGVGVDSRTQRVTASCAIDNLVKGAAGQAIQAANAAVGLAETAGLSAAGMYP